jgi:hypothetical protein
MTNNASTLVLGIVIGMLGGFLLGALLGKSVFQLAAVLIHTVNRRTRSENDRMKFELLLQ